MLTFCPHKYSQAPRLYLINRSVTVYHTLWRKSRINFVISAFSRCCKVHGEALPTGSFSFSLSLPCAPAHAFHKCRSSQEVPRTFCSLQLTSRRFHAPPRHPPRLPQIPRTSHGFRIPLHKFLSPYADVCIPRTRTACRDPAHARNSFRIPFRRFRFPDTVSVSPYAYSAPTPHRLVANRNKPPVRASAKEPSHRGSGGTRTPSRREPAPVRKRPRTDTV